MEFDRKYVLIRTEEIVLLIEPHMEYAVLLLYLFISYYRCYPVAETYCSPFEFSFGDILVAILRITLVFHKIETFEEVVFWFVDKSVHVEFLIERLFVEIELVFDIHFEFKFIEFFPTVKPVSYRLHDSNSLTLAHVSYVLIVVNNVLNFVFHKLEMIHSKPKVICSYNVHVLQLEDFFEFFLVKRRLFVS